MIITSDCTNFDTAAFSGRVDTEYNFHPTLHSIYAQDTTLSASRATLSESLTPESCFRIGSSAFISAVYSSNLKLF